MQSAPGGRCGGRANGTLKGGRASGSLAFAPFRSRLGSLFAAGGYAKGGCPPALALHALAQCFHEITLIPAQVILLFDNERRDDVQAFAAGRLAERDKAKRSRRSRISFAAAMTASKETSGAGSRSKTSLPGIAGWPGWLSHG
jgi:hypothetical protein